MYHNTSAALWQYDGTHPDPAILSFHQKLPHYAVTPLTPLPQVASDLGLGHVFVKDESNRLDLPAFKILGASWAVHKALAQRCNLSLTSSLEAVGEAARERNTRLVTCTEGNWGRAVARMAKYMQLRAIIFVPDFMDDFTITKIANEGAEVIVVHGDYDICVARAKQEAGKSRDSLLIMDVSWEGYEEIPEWVVQGYTTMLIETDEQLRERGINTATHAIAAVGVGSWAQAVTMHYKSSKTTSTTIVAVEPATAASLQTSLRTGKIVSIKTGHTIMNGMNCGTTSTTAWKVLKDGVDVSVTVTDAEVHRDLCYLRNHYSVPCGPCGAATLSALRRLCKKGAPDLGLDANATVILFSTEGTREYETPTDGRRE